VISGAHVIVFSRQAEALRAFFSDVLGFDSVDAVGGWPIYALPMAELAVHPADGEDSHELYLMCDDLEATTKWLKEKGVELSRPVTEQRWGRTTAIQVPGAGEVALYEPKHPRPNYPGTGASTP
jgi:catechol 2,3-dioxygenase-like lactoylglutathione lyase family enzyme